MLEFDFCVTCDDRNDFRLTSMWETSVSRPVQGFPEHRFSSIIKSNIEM